MNILFDIILLAVFAFFVIRCFIKGFAGSILSFGHALLAILLTIAFGELISPWISSVIAGSFAPVISYIILFIIFYVGLYFLSALIRRIVKLPVLKQFDKLLGILLGILLGWINISFLSTLLYVIIKLANHPEIYHNSFIFKLTQQLNFFAFLIDKML